MRTRAPKTQRALNPQHLHSLRPPSPASPAIPSHLYNGEKSMYSLTVQYSTFLLFNTDPTSHAQLSFFSTISSNPSVGSHCVVLSTSPSRIRSVFMATRTSRTLHPIPHCFQCCRDETEGKDGLAVTPESLRYQNLLTALF